MGLRILTGKTHPQIKLTEQKMKKSEIFCAVTQALTKTINIDIWVIGALNQLFMRGCYI